MVRALRRSFANGRTPRCRCSQRWPSGSAAIRPKDVNDARSGRSLPTGTVTFLRTDVEGSMVLARELGDGWDRLNAMHLTLLRDAIERHDGIAVRTEGDALFAAFPEAGVAILAASEG